MDRRTTLKWMLAASASLPLSRHASAAVPQPGAAQGYGTDPNLTKAYHAGDVWPLILSPGQRRTAAALCDVIIPADEHSPSASSVGVVDFIDEWVSAPYPRQREDRAVVLPGLAWMNAEAKRRFAKEFAHLDPAQCRALCDDICGANIVRPEFAQGTKFFARFRDLTAGGFYSSAAGRQDLKYTGNVPLVKFDGPPPELLRKLGLPLDLS